MARRRKRVEEWRAKKAAEAAEAEAAQAAEAAVAAAAAAEQQPQAKGWSLEDDDDDLDEGGGGGGDDDEPDPLDAFMADNAVVVKSPAAKVMAVHAAGGAAGEAAANGAGGEEDDQVDPLDAFMSAEIMPEVAKVGL